MQTDDLKRAALSYAQMNADQDGLAVTSVPGLRLMVRETAYGTFHSIYRPLVCMVLQGAKLMIVGIQENTFHAGESVVVSADMPVTGRVVQADRQSPYLAVAVELDAGMIKEIGAEMALDRDAAAPPTRTLFSVNTEEAALSCASRLLQLMDAPQAIALLQPGIMRELHFWLLSGRHGAAVRALGLPDSHASRLGRAIAHLREKYREPIRSGELAQIASMGETAFHRHFKAMTSLTPGQFHKRLRLIEARRLMLNEGCSASLAAFEVGYKSVSQFTREYSALFGLSPMRHVAALSDAVHAS